MDETTVLIPPSQPVDTERESELEGVIETPSPQGLGPRSVEQTPARVSTAEKIQPLIDHAREAGEGEYEAVFDGLVVAMQSDIYRRIYGMVGEPELAGDLTQDVLLKMWRGLADIISARNPSAYMYSMVINVVLDHRRQTESRPTTTAFSDFHPSSDDVEGAVLKKLEHEVVRTAVNALKPEDRAVIKGRYDDGLSNFQIGDRLGKKEGTVKVRHHRALKDLRARLEEA